MSRVGKLPITVPDSVKLSNQNGDLTFSSGSVEVKYSLNNQVDIEIKDGVITLLKKDNNTTNLGLHRSNINNIVVGLTDGFKVTLEVNGVGYKSSVKGKMLILSLGYSHDIYYQIPDDVKIETQKPNLIVISGHDKMKVGQVAAKIRGFREVEPYKGKGVNLLGRKILRKEGKKK